MPKTDWYQRGVHDYNEKVPRIAAPTPVGLPAGDEWRDGWDSAAKVSELEGKQSLEIAYPELILKAGKLVLIDDRGRVIGVQIGIVVEQHDDEVSASVTFAGLQLHSD